MSEVRKARAKGKPSKPHLGRKENAQLPAREAARCSKDVALGEMINALKCGTSSLRLLLSFGIPHFVAIA
jgi:hypothetical protein